MDREQRRRDVLRAASVIITTSVSGCFREVRNPGGDHELTPTPTTSPVPMDPFDASNAGLFESVAHIEREIFYLTNEARTSRGIERLKWDPDLAYMGREHCRDMAEKGFYSHENKEGEIVRERMQKYGLNDTYSGVTENIAKRGPVNPSLSGAQLGQRFFEMWKDSESHWRTIMGEDIDRVGVGVYIREDREAFAAQEFGFLHT